MSDSADSDDPLLPDAVRSVTPPSGTHPDATMSAFGWLILAGLLVLLLPVLPLLVLVWLLDKASDSVSGR